MNVIVITGVELGWDCVVGVFDCEQDVLESWLNMESTAPADTIAQFKEDNDTYVLHYKTIENVMGN